MRVLSVRLAVFLSVLCTASPAVAAGPEISVEPCFYGPSLPGLGFGPQAVTIKAGSAPVVGNVRIECYGYQWSHTYNAPAAVAPHHSQKILFYPNPTFALYGRSEAVVLATTDGGEITDILPERYPCDTQRVVSNVADNPLVVGYIGSKIPGEALDAGERYGASTISSPGCSFNIRYGYAQPASAPNRPEGYAQLAMVVLGAGADALTAEQWSALKIWTMSGGAVVVLGGSNPSVARAAEAAGLLPMTNLRPSSFPCLVLRNTMLAPNPDRWRWDRTLQAVTGDLMPGAVALAKTSGKITIARRNIGMGDVTFVAVDPVEDRIVRDCDIPTFWNAIYSDAAPTVWVRDLQMVDQGTRWDNPSLTDVSHVDAFHIHLLPPVVVGGVLFVYFVLAVPGTYLALRRFGRQELAWGVGPLVSLSFAFVFFAYTAPLYRKPECRRTIGTIVLAEGAPTARFMGCTETFLPHEAAYSVNIPGADFIDTAPDQAGLQDADQVLPTANLSTLDNGVVSVPALTVPNLSFERLYHNETVTVGGSVTGTLRILNGQLVGSIHNGTNLTLTGCRMKCSQTNTYVPLPALAPGQSAILGKNFSMGKRWSRQTDAVILDASTSGTPFGPRLGRDVSAATSVAVAIGMQVINERR